MMYKFRLELLIHINNIMNKQINAKLEKVLDSLELSKENKNNLRDIFEECSADGGSSSNEFVIGVEQVEENGTIEVYYNFNGKYRAKGSVKSTQFDVKTITNTEIYNYCLENMTSNIIVDAGIFKVTGYITICNDNKPSLCLVNIATELTGGSGSVLAAETKFFSQVIIEPSNEN